jgi:hypothetical protein
MRFCGSRIAMGLSLLLMGILALPGSALGQGSSYLNHDGLTRELRSVANSSNAVRMESLGTTLEGREIWVLEIGNSAGMPMDDRPAVLVVANLEGNHLVGSHLALEMVRYLVENAGNDAVADILNNQTIYVFPRLNPDGAEAMFADVKWERRTNAFDFDDDNDGRTNEDGPDDLNGDGFITMMRVADPAGPYMVDPQDDRILKRADASKGETGTFKIYWEGTDNDNDGFINEDGPGGVDLNRNFQHAYPYWQSDAGLHMVSEVETRALMDFVLAHGNIGAVFTFGLTDNLVTPPDSRGGLAGASILDLPVFADASNADVFSTGMFQAGGGGGRGFGGFGGFGRGNSFLRGAQPGRDNDPSSGTRPATTVNGGDVVYFTAASEAYKEITGIQKVPVHRTPEGAFFQYGYFHFGVPSFSTLGWALPEAETEEGDSPTRGGGGGNQTPPAARSGTPPAAAGGRMAGGGAMGMRPGGAQVRGGGAAGGSGADGTVLKALESAGIDAFADWSTYTHPTLGEVEIGGFLPYATTNPPFQEVAALGVKHGEFLVKLAGMLPRVRIADTKVEALGGGVFSVTVEVENTGFFPTTLRHGQVSRSVQATTVQIQVDQEDILTGAAKTSRVPNLAGSGSRESFTWVIQGREGSQVDIKLRAQKGGTDSATITLR